MLLLRVLILAVKEMHIGKALAWQFISKYANVIIQFAITMVLARILTPEEYGTVAIVTVFTTLFSTLSDVGVGPAIVQYDDLDMAACSGLFTFTAIFGAALSLLFFFASSFIAIFYSDAQLLSLCRWASLSILFGALDMVPNGLMLRKKQFRAIGLRLLLSSFLSGAVAIILAILGFGAYALVANSVIQSAVIFLWNMRVSGLKIGNRHFVAPVKRVFYYSLYQALFTTVNYFARNLDTLVMGRAMNSATVGQYDKAYKLSTYPNSYLSGIVASVLQPYLVRYKNMLDKIYEYYLMVAKTVTILGAWATALLCICSKEIIYVMYGPQWSDAGLILTLLGFSVVFQVLNSIAGAVFQSIEHTDYMLATSLINTTLTVSGVVIGALSKNVYILSFLVAMSYALSTLTNSYYLVYKGLHNSLFGFLKRLVPEFIIAVSSLLLGQISISTSSGNLILDLFIKGLLVSVICFVVFKLTGQFKYLKNAYQIIRGKNAPVELKSLH